MPCSPEFQPALFDIPWKIGLAICYICGNLLLLSVNSRIIQKYKFTRMKITILVFLTLLGLAIAKPIYDFKKSYVTNLTPLNFADQVSKIRQNTNYVSVVQFYKYSDGKSLKFVPEMDKWTNEYRGVFKIGAVDCDEYQSFCAKEAVTKFPTIKIIPPVPIPVVIYPDEELSIDKIQKLAAKYLHSNLIEITNSNINTFLQENPSVPKVLLFTDKPKGTPMVYKGLSVAFQKKLNFGLVRSNDTILVDRYGIKSFPSVIVIKTGEKKPIFYKGKQFNFENLFEFLNIYSQAFVPGGGSSLDSSATKQWMTEVFPEMYSKSARDICLGGDALCVILLTTGKPSKEISSNFDALNSKYDRKIDRGAKFKFMWLDVSKEKKWAELFKYNGEDKVVVLNPGKRKRYTDHEGQITKDAISTTLDKISGGDARFNRISELPAFQLRVD